MFAPGPGTLGCIIRLAFGGRANMDRREFLSHSARLLVAAGLSPRMFAENRMPESNQRRPLSFSNDWIESVLVTAVREMPGEDAIVVNLSPVSAITQQASVSASPRRYRLKLNLWYTPEETDCGIHTGHQFLEVHTQVLGTGHMQKFRENNAETLYEDVLMPPGFTHDP